MSQENQSPLQRLEAELRGREAGLSPSEIVLALAEQRRAMREGREDRAVQVLRTTLRNSYERQALAYSQRGQWMQAREWFLKAADHAEGKEFQTLDQNMAICYFNLGLEYEETEKDHEALESFTQATEYHPGYAKAHYARAKALARIFTPHMPESRPVLVQAVEALQKAISLDASYRAVAQRDADFDSIRGEDLFRLFVS